VRNILKALTAWALLSFVGLYLFHIRPTIPVSFLLVLLLVMPWGYLLTAMGEAIAALKLPAPLMASAGIVAGLAYVWAFGSNATLFMTVNVVSLGIAGASLITRPPTFESVQRVAVAVLALFVGFLAIWASNYLVLAMVTPRFYDPALKSTDIFLYRTVFRVDVDYAASFPLVRNIGALTLLQNAYSLQFAEISAVLLALTGEKAAVKIFLTRFFFCYVVALLVFAAAPVVGPYLYFPASIDLHALTSTTRLLMTGGLAEFDAVRTGARSATGFGYFVGLPSLHSAVATLLQCTFWQSRRLRWVVTPINVLTVLSTFLLGYHYLLDTAAGIALGSASVALLRSRETTE